ncbi:MAG: carboxypeptidase regulatory-like domain-containing protein [Bacteroidetes bacterium]|nr:carboxypeptidase regulatory-like domain-containing protein [Bacteroidota bacterium]
MYKHLLLFILYITAHSSFAQNTHQGEISGYVTDNQFVKIKNIKLSLTKENQIIQETFTDSNGFYSFTFLSPGEYHILIKKSKEITFRSESILLLSEEPSKFDFVYSNQVEINGYIYGGTKDPRGIKPPPPPPCLTCIAIVFNPKITHLGPNIENYLAMAPGMNKTAGGWSSGGNRPNNNSTMQNGRRINSDGVIFSNLSQVELSSGGISVRYGDLTGGLISYLTQSPSYTHTGTAQYLTSSGLDGRNYNHIEGSFRGPLLIKNERMILGYVFAGNYIYNKDPNPSIAGYNQVNKNISDSINAHPLRISGSTLENKTNSLTANDWSHKQWNLGNGKTTANIFGALEWSPRKGLTINGEFTYMNTQTNSVSLYNSLFNSDAVATTTNNQLTGSLRMNHVLVSADTKPKNKVKNAWYSLRVDYNSQWSETMDAKHGRNFFDYGYLGKFESKRNQNYKYINLGMNGVKRSFTTKTPDGMRDTAKSNVDLINVGAEAGVKIVGSKNSFHDLLFGIQYEQRTYRSYTLNANNLWTLMRNLSHQSDPNFDLDHPIAVYDNQGHFLDTIRYNYIVDPNSKNSYIETLRNRLIASGATDELGNPYNQNSKIETDRIDPSFYKLSDFSADELLNGGKSSLVNYYGYDYLGNKIKGKTSIESFLNNKDRNVGAFKPIYTSFYIQDRFNLRDFSFQVGVRVENYDANQSVLKDAYSLYPTKTVREVKAEKSTLSSMVNPTMSDDAYVYVNDVNNPTNITGYRVNKSNNQADWFDKNGNSLGNPEELAHVTSNGRIAPYLVDPKKQQITAASFKDYKSQWNILPRLWFKFPITTEAFFFAHYDVYAQRPPEGVISTIDDYYFLPQRSTEIINNPALKTVKRTDYELGFKHRVGRSGLLSFIANYSEVRNLIQVTRFNQAFPVSYTSFGNLDFSTIKSFRLEYQSNGKNLGIIANYMLQFADGTGSNALSSSSLISSGQPNLRNVYPLDYDFRHVIKCNIEWHFNDREGLVGKRYIFENSGINISNQVRSGTPYTRILFPVNTVQEGISNRTMMDGSINGSRMAWSFNSDVYMFKNFNIKRKIDSLPPTKQLSIFLWVQNIFNFKNIQSVYQYTGSASDDGYLASEWGKQALRNEKYAQSFTDMYNAKLLNPGNFGAPRLFQLGIKYIY